MPGPAEYIPGVCNIGRAEIAARRRLAWVALATTIIAWGLFVVAKAAPAWRLLLFFPASIAATGFLQAAFHFCATFGLLGWKNFGPQAGRADTVEQSEFRRQDRRTSIKIFALSALAGAVVAVLAYFVPR